jgi:glycerophosphoryl diester phosphodiesterase
VAELSYAELRQVDVGSWFNQTHRSRTVDFSGERIPSLDEVLELFESNNAILYLEMKSDPFKGNNWLESVAIILKQSP